MIVITLKGNNNSIIPRRQPTHVIGCLFKDWFEAKSQG